MQNILFQTEQAPFTLFFKVLVRLVVTCFILVLTWLFYTHFFSESGYVCAEFTKRTEKVIFMRRGENKELLLHER